MLIGLRVIVWFINSVAGRLFIYVTWFVVLMLYSLPDCVVLFASLHWFVLLCVVCF